MFFFFWLALIIINVLGEINMIWLWNDHNQSYLVFEVHGSFSMMSSARLKSIRRRKFILLLSFFNISISINQYKQAYTVLNRLSPQTSSYDKLRITLSSLLARIVLLTIFDIITLAVILLFNHFGTPIVPPIILHSAPWDAFLLTNSTCFNLIL